jgi:predicted NBD/HSP70 family sugar kinase
MIYVPARMGQLNRRALLRQLLKFGVASRADLAKSLGMSQPTAGKIVDELLAAGVLEEIELAENAGEESPRGRPGRQLRLNQSRPCLLGIKLGMEKTSMAPLSLNITDADQWRFSFSLDPHEPRPAWKWETQLRSVAQTIGGQDFLGVLLSVPGIVDENKNRVLFSPNLHWTEQSDLAAMVRQIWNVPVILVQEERALALGYSHTNPDCEDFLLVDFGEGVGGAVIVDGKPIANPLPLCGEIGHTPVFGNRRRCGCGATGCMETLVSLRGLLESFAAARGGKKSSWADLQKHISKNGIPAWLAESLEAAAVSIAGALNVLGLRRVVITGSLTDLPPAVVGYLARAIQNGSMWAKFGTVECVAAPHRRIAGLVAIGIDRLVVPDTPDPVPLPHEKFRRQTVLLTAQKSNRKKSINHEIRIS